MKETVDKMATQFRELRSSQSEGYSRKRANLASVSDHVTQYTVEMQHSFT